jgi:hypothetical protein
VSRPRKPFGATHPGRLPATMIKVLAAEMSDPQRLRRGKQYARDGSVLDIDVAPGIVVCEVQGSRSSPYVASLEVRPGDGMPLRRDVTAHCTCPDDENFQGHACKHVVATMFVFSDELLLEPELLDIWRQTSSSRDQNDACTGDDAPAVRRRHLTLVSPRPVAHGRPVEPEPEPVAVDPLADVLVAPPGTSLPALPEIGPGDYPPPPRPELAAVLRDALAHVRIEWD